MNTATGIILVGGKSSRFGSDKALVKFNNKTTIEIIAGMFIESFNEIIIIANNPEPYKFLGYKIYPDLYLNKGPLAGIHSGLSHSNNKRNFFISCDLPLMKKEIIEYLINYKTSKAILLPKDEGKIHFLCGVYEKGCLHRAVELLKTNNGMKNLTLSMHNFIQGMKVEILKVDMLPFYSRDIFFNMNTPEDYEYLKSNFFNHPVANS